MQLASLWFGGGRVQELAIDGLVWLQIELVRAVFDFAKDFSLFLQVLHNRLSLYLLAFVCGLCVNIKNRLFIEAIDRNVHVLIHLEDLLVLFDLLFPFSESSVLKLNRVLLVMASSLHDQARLKVNERARRRYDHLDAKALWLKQQIRIEHPAFFPHRPPVSLFPLDHHRRCCM